mgnify:CR=1 FL=1
MIDHVLIIITKYGSAFRPVYVVCDLKYGELAELLMVDVIVCIHLHLDQAHTLEKQLQLLQVNVIELMLDGTGVVHLQVEVIILLIVVIVLITNDIPGLQEQA